MSKKLQFKKGIELKNKTTIEVLRGWNSCFRIKTNELDEKGKNKYKYFDKYFVLEFKIIEDGTDETIKRTRKQDSIENDFFISDDMLPF